MSNGNDRCVSYHVPTFERPIQPSQVSIEIKVGIETKVADHGRDEQLTGDVKHTWVVGKIRLGEA